MSALGPRRTGLLGGSSAGVGVGGGGGSSGIGPNVTPMVDVVLVILIFFMASASIAGHEWFLESLVAPEQRQQAEARDDADETSISTAPALRLPDVVVPVHLSVDENGSVFAVVFGGAATNLAGVRDAIAGLIENAPADEVIVRLSADGNTPYDAVVRVREMCVQLGITRVAIVASR